MTQHGNTSLSGRSTRGGAVATVLLIILATVLILFGTILLIAMVGITIEGDPSILILLPFLIATLAGGIVIIVSLVHAHSKDDKASGTASGRSKPANADETSGERVVSAIPVTQSMRDQPAQPQGGSDASSPTEDVAHLVFRSEDLFATLRDLVRHASSDKRHLASMLDAAGVMSWPEAPACEGGRLSRNTHFWIRLSTDGLDDAQYDTLVTAEAALSVNQDLPELRTVPVESPEAIDASLRLLRQMPDQKIDRSSLTDEGLMRAYGTEDQDSQSGEWIVRSQVCNAAECVRTPFRVVYDLRANVRDGLAVLSLEIPRPRCMAIFTPEPARQVALARAYALRLSVLLARHAFDATKQIETVVVNCHEHESEETLLSLHLTRSLADTLYAVCRDAKVEQGFPTDTSIRATFSGGWFAPVEPFVALDDPQATMEEARRFPELDQRVAPDAVRRACHAERICDLGINENAGRIEAWSDVRPRLGDSTEHAVSELVALRNASTDITVAEACTRTIQALVEGKAELDDLSSLASLFVDGSALDSAVARASQLIDDSDGHEDPQAAVKLLEQALAPIEDMGGYLDDETCVYRYFGSVSERIHHNATVNEGGREIRLVPDAYFNAHSNASIAYGMLGDNERALAHADVCLRLAPTSTYATMRKVRVLESESRVYEAAELIVEALRHAVTPRDAAICHYRLAYMEWKLGREDLAVACYQRALTWDTEMAQQAREELNDLLESNPQLERLSDEQADALLAREGIPLGCVRSDGEHTLGAAVACMDAGAFLSARPLMAVLFGMNGDDVVMGVYRSLNVSV